MISIVCSSITPDENYKKEILNNIGLKNVEFLHYENKGEYSLTELYQKGLNDSKYSIVLFIHDDIIVNTKNWGRKLMKHFKETNYGVLGVAGTTKLSEDGTWWKNQEHMVGIVNHSHNGKTYASKYSANLGDKIVKTLLVDGVFFAVQKDRLEYQFDTSVDGFHFYDLDFSFGNHINGCDVGVMFDIRITHLSIGQTNDKWEASRIKFVTKWLKGSPIEIVGEMFYDHPNIKIKKEPKVSIIIPHINNHELLYNCLHSIKRETNYSNYEILVADTGSKEGLEQVEAYIEGFSGAKLIKYNYYNFGKINNEVALNHVSDDSELLLFCNNDIELINDAISIMVKYYLKNKNTVGTIGPRLYFGNEKIQHAGIFTHYSQSTHRFGISHLGLQSYYGYSEDPTKVIGNTGAFLMVNKNLFNQIGGFNENYTECFEDVEFNLQVLLKGKTNINLSDAVCWHFESSTRNEDPNKLERLEEDYSQRLMPFINNNRDEKILKLVKILR